ncbi:hypothetical protein IJT17_02895 [bacterium]|nr:hypothetical protein [bacterium]
MSLRIPKDRKQVTIYTHNHRIEGEIYLVADSRLTDELNVRARDFFAVTNAKVYSLHGDTFLHSVDFLTVNKNAVEVVLTSGPMLAQE